MRPKKEFDVKYNVTSVNSIDQYFLTELSACLSTFLITPFKYMYTCPITI